MQQQEYAEPYVKDGVGYIPLWGSGRRGSRGSRVCGWAMVDSEDYDSLAHRRWCSVAGYAMRREGGRWVQMHRLVLGLGRGKTDKRLTDHVNRNRLDNRKANLRVVDGAQNAQNLSVRSGTSRHRGVSFDKHRGKWVAQGKVGSVTLWKLFDGEDEAAAAALAFRREHMPYAVD